MHCPRCGTSAKVGQQFCRSCGLGLEKVSQLVDEQVAPQTDPLSDLAPARERQQKFERWGGIARLSVFGLALITVLGFLISKMMLSGSVGMSDLSLLLIAIAAGITVGLQTYSRSLKRKVTNPALPKAARRLEPERLDPDQSLTLESYREPVPTVTDRTTELLTKPKGANTKKLDA